MNYTLFCTVALLASLLTVLAAIVIGIRTHRARVLGEGVSHAILTPFQLFLLCFFVGALFVFLPPYYIGYAGEEMWIVRVLKTFFLSLYSAMRLFILDSDFEVVEAIVSDPQLVSPWLGKLYSVYTALLVAAAPVMTASFVLSFFKNVSSYVKYYLNFSNHIYYISDLNETSIALATDIVAKSEGGMPLIVFFDVFEADEDTTRELIDRARRLGAVLFQKDITELALKRSKRNAIRKFYFISEKEDENIKQALTLINYCRGIERYNTADTQFYVFSTTVDSEALLDAVDNGSMKVRRVNEKRNLVINALLEYPIFDTQLEQNGEKQLNVLIVGSGSYGDEFLKSICWCGQLPGYKLTLHVVDKIPDLEARIACRAPELVANNHKLIEGEPFYSIHFHPNIDVKTNAFAALLAGIGNVTAAFVTLGNDELNVEIAMKLRAEFGRLQLKKGYFIPHIFAVVYNTLKTDTFAQSGGLKCLGKDDYGIKFIGDMRTRYSLAVIEQLELEAKGMQIHLAWLEHQKAVIRQNNADEAEINAKIEESKQAYDKFEYYRRTSIATAVHASVLNKLHIYPTQGHAQQSTEHNRWSAFMRAEGYVFDASARNHIAKTHPDLIPFAVLDDAEQKKDEVAVLDPVT